MVYSKISLSVGTSFARSFRVSTYPSIASFAEAGNVAWKQVVFSLESKDRALDALKDCRDFITTSCTLLKASDLTAVAFEIAVENKISYYDSLFLAAAQEREVPLLTLDRELYEKVKAKRDVLTI